MATEAFSGSHTLDVKATDLLGNENTFEGIVVNVDSEVPELSAPPTPDGGVVDELPFQIRNGQTGAPQMLFSAQDGHNHVQVQFDVSESLDASDDSNANLAVTLAGHTMDCGSYQAQSPNYTCTYVVTGEESEGGNLIEINGKDGAGNTVYANQAVQFDFTPPQWVSGTVSLSLQGPLNDEVDLSNYDVSALALGGQVSFSGAVSESLSERQVVLDINGDSFIDADDIFLDASVTSGNFVGFNLTLTESVSDGVYPLLFRFVDTVGNATADGFNMIEMADGTMTQVTIDQTPPSAPNQSRILFVKSRWGHEVLEGEPCTEGVPCFYLRGEVGAVEPNSRVFVSKAQDFSNMNLVAQGQAESDGHFNFAVGDVNWAYVRVVDAAGNVSDVGGNGGLIFKQEWVGTFYNKVPLSTVENPHRVQMAVASESLPSGHGRWQEADSIPAGGQTVFHSAQKIGVATFESVSGVVYRPIWFLL